jgi:threonine-phosphate decarboxylase
MIRIDRVHGGNRSDGVLDFSASINPLGPPRAALDAYHAAVAHIASYPPAYSHHLEAALAGWLGVEPEWVLAGNGSTQLIYLLARVLKPRLPLIVSPTFSELANSLIIEGIEPRALNITSDCNFQLRSEAAIKCLRDGADAIFIGRPNSPTGTILKIDEAAEIATASERHDSWCVLDEAFIDFVQGARSGVEFVEKNRKIIVLRSLTKIFAIPGCGLDALSVTRMRSENYGTQLNLGQSTPWPIMSLVRVLTWSMGLSVKLANSSPWR